MQTLISVTLVRPSHESYKTSVRTGTERKFITSAKRRSLHPLGHWVTMSVGSSMGTYLFGATSFEGEVKLFSWDTTLNFEVLQSQRLSNVDSIQSAALMYNNGALYMPYCSESRVGVAVYKSHFQNHDCQVSLSHLRGSFISPSARRDSFVVAPVRPAREAGAFYSYKFSVDNPTSFDSKRVCTHANENGIIGGAYDDVNEVLAVSYRGGVHLFHSGKRPRPQWHAFDSPVSDVQCGPHNTGFVVGCESGISEIRNDRVTTFHTNGRGATRIAVNGINEVCSVDYGGLYIVDRRQRRIARSFDSDGVRRLCFVSWPEDPSHIFAFNDSGDCVIWDCRVTNPLQKHSGDNRMRAWSGVWGVSIGSSALLKVLKSSASVSRRMDNCSSDYNDNYHHPVSNLHTSHMLSNDARMGVPGQEIGYAQPKQPHQSYSEVGLHAPYATGQAMNGSHQQSYGTYQSPSHMPHNSAAAVGMMNSPSYNPQPTTVKSVPYANSMQSHSAPYDGPMMNGRHDIVPHGSSYQCVPASVSGQRGQLNTSAAGDHVRGALLGLAIGDAVGTTNEFKPRGTFPQIYDMVGGGPFNLNPGEWTDDTSMALCLAESLIHAGQFSLRDQLKRYVKWWKEGYLSSNGRCFDIGGTVRTALERFLRSNERETLCGSTDRDSSGNGSLMRLAPIPMCFFNNPEACIFYAGESSKTTHGSQIAVDACRYFAGLIVAAIHGRRKDEILRPLYSFTHPNGVWPAHELCPEVLEVAGGSFMRKRAHEIETTGYVIATLEAALFILYNTNSFMDGVLMAANMGGDADTVAAVYGQIAGALYGYSQLPRTMLQKLAYKEKITNMADQLLSLAVDPLGWPNSTP